MNGFINLLKPAGMTSHDAVFALRRILRTKKIGHTGTLDPMAAGVLSMCICSATRAAEYLEADNKSYRCELKLGITTDTGDIWGKTLKDDSGAVADINKEQILNVIEEMKGPQAQYPPIYSAIRKNGKHLYEYARNGESVEIEPRNVVIHDIRPIHVLEETGIVMFDVECTKGTYIRSLCTDIGEKLGCGASMSFLVRTRSGKFDIKDSVTLEQMLGAVTQAEGLCREDILSVRQTGELKADMSEFFLPIDSMLSDFGIIELDADETAKFTNGGKIAYRNAKICAENTRSADSKFSSRYIVYGPGRKFTGTSIYDKEKKIFKVDKVFFR